MSQRIQKIIDNSQTIFFYWQAKENWPVEYVSNNVAMFGYSVEDFTCGRLKYTDIIHPDDLVRILQEVEDYAADGIDQFAQRYRIFTAQGEVRWIDDRTVVERGASGQPKYYLGTIIDITAQIAAEDARRAEHAFTQKILDNLQEPVMVINADYSIQFMNNALKELMDPSKVADFTQPKCYEVSHHRSSPCDGKSHPCPLRDVIKSKSEVNVVHRHKDAKGNDLFVQLNASPLIDKHGKVTGIIESEHDITKLVKAKNDLKKQANLLSFQATHDVLTGLPNRRLFLDSLDFVLERIQRHEGRLAMAFVDVDKFKTVNDQWGHEAGDVVLIEVANRLKAVLRSMDMVARIGGDEFTIFLEDFESVEQVEVVMQKMIRQFVEPFEINNQLVQVGVSIGVALFPEDAVNRKALIKAADMALYDVKAKGRNHYQFYQHIDSE